MRHINTEHHPSKGWIVRWLAPEADSTQTPIFERDFSRIVIGACLEEGPHAVILGERRVYFTNKSAHYYMVLDEAHAELVQDLFDQIISLKDRYLVPMVAVPTRPPDLVSALRGLDGLTHYVDENEHTAQVIWPTFYSFDTLATIRVQEGLEEKALHAQLSEHIAANVIQPDGSPLLDGNDRPVKRIHLPGDLNCRETAAALRQAAIGPCTALLFAIEALWSTRNVKGRRNDTRPEPRKANPHTGY